MRLYLHVKILITLLIFHLGISYSYGGEGTTAANFLKLPQGNRATAMGSNFVAFADGPTSLYWNPAGLATGIFNEGRAVFNRWVQGIYYGYAGYRHSLDIGGFGGAVTYLTSGQIPKRGTGREDTGETYNLQNIAVDIGQGLKVSDYVNLGMSLKFIYESIDGERTNALAGGLGFQYRRRFDEHFLHLGLSIMNLGTPMGYEEKFPLPAVVRFGVGNIMLNGRLKGSASGSYYLVESKITGGLGIEFAAAPFLDLRCGYRFGYKDVQLPYGLTFGIGFKYIEEVEYLFDYSVATLGDLGFINRIGFGVRF